MRTELPAKLVLKREHKQILHDRTSTHIYQRLVLIFSNVKLAFLQTEVGLKN